MQCAGGPEEANSHEEGSFMDKTIAEGKVPMCAAICSLETPFSLALSKFQMCIENAL